MGRPAFFQSENRAPEEGIAPSEYRRAPRRCKQKPTDTSRHALRKRLRTCPLISSPCASGERSAAGPDQSHGSGPALRGLVMFRRAQRTSVREAVNEKGEAMLSLR